MCRLFNEENSLQQTLQQNDHQTKSDQNNRRLKRDIESEPLNNPLLNKEDIIRVEGIVDKLYDDLQENEEKVTYRRRNLENLTTTKPVHNNRRFNFAPAKLLPLEGGTTESSSASEHYNSTHAVPTTSDINVPWIKKWKHGIIPYFIDPKTYDNYLSETIIKAFDYIEKSTCIRLQRLRVKPLDEKSMQQAEWLYITNPSGIKQCVHSNERKPNLGVQMVVFGYDCLSQGEIAHEIMHVLGFSHEHTRPDRDQYITINWKNIKAGYKKYFNLQSDNSLTYLPYDYASVLHYPPRAFSKNGHLTFSVASGIKIGQREGFSELDVEKIGTIFGTECTKRNKDYLLKTCPSVVKGKTNTEVAKPEEIKKYFENRTWPYGVVNFKIKDNMEFSTEEKQNIKAVLIHIETETCIEFRDISDIETDICENSSEIKKPVYNSRKSKVNKGEEDIRVNEISLEDKNEKTLRRTKDEILPVSNKKINKTVWNKETVKKTTTKQQSTIVNRRHAGNVLVLTRSTEPGCQCPPSGRPNGNKVVQINSDCFNSVNDLLHFFVHIVGLDHQHNMHDRDSYIQIVWDQLTPELKSEMKKKLPPAASVGFPYDYQSVMHFPWLQIKDGVTNIMYPIWNDGWAMGHWQGLSVTDVKKLNRIYKNECANRRNQANV